MSWGRLFLIVLIAGGTWKYWNGHHTHAPAVSVVASQPAAQDQSSDAASNGAADVDDETQRGNAGTRGMPAAWQDNGYRITPLEKFRFDARVLSTEHYAHDRESDLVPVDLALGWGPMDNPAVLTKIDISQSNRFYYWHVNEFPIPRRDIEIHSANMHLIPATAAIERALKAVEPGQHVSFSGYLVEAQAGDGWHWRSSLTREDTGNGACELVWVENFSAN